LTAPSQISIHLWKSGCWKTLSPRDETSV